MFPKEHGAYGQLLFPIATAFAVGRLRWPAVALAAAAVCAFIAHEPLLVLIGQRGPRVQRELRARAWRWLSAFGGASLASGIAAVVALPRAAGPALAFTVALTAFLAGFIAFRREHTLFGESWMSITTASLAAPMALALDASARTALTLACAFTVVFVTPTIAVHAVIAHTRRPPAVGDRIGAVALTALLSAATWQAASHGVIAQAGVWAVGPACGVAIVLAAAPPSARRLRVVGWTLVATSIAAAAILIAGL